MGLNIKDEAVVAIARRLATETGDTMTGVIRKALQDFEDRQNRQNNDYWSAIIAERRQRGNEVLSRLPAWPAGVTSDTSDFYDDDGFAR